MKIITFLTGVALVYCFGMNSVFAQQKSGETLKTKTSKIATLKPNHQKSNSNKALCSVSVDCTDGDVILGVSFSNINNPTNCSPNGYGDYRILTANISAGVPTPIAVAVGNGYYQEDVGAWVDYNNDEQFTDEEFMYIGEGSGNTINSSFTIPSNTPAGIYTIRFMVYAGPVDSDMGCYDDFEDYGEFEDYTLNVTAAAACDVLPTSITLSTSENSVCTGSLINLTADYTPTETGLSYQLQSSTDGTSWTNIQAPSQLTNFTETVNENIQFRIILSCSENGSSVTSNIVSISLKTILECMCIPVLDCTDGDNITDVAFPALNFSNTSSCGIDGYSDFQSLSIPDLIRDSSYTLNVTVGGGYEFESVSVWIDFNDNGIFESSEFTYLGTDSASIVSGQILIPLSAPIGSHIMRVRVAAVDQLGATDDLACDEDQGYGETEDYTINIVEGGDLSVNQSQLDKVFIYPNPTNDELNVSSMSINATINIVDLTGRIIQTINTKAGSATKINLSNFETGTYNLVISDENSSVVKRIVKN